MHCSVNEPNGCFLSTVLHTLQMLKSDWYSLLLAATENRDASLSYKQMFRVSRLHPSFTRFMLSEGVADWEERLSQERGEMNSSTTFQRRVATEWG
jgi:hypothetical protein